MTMDANELITFPLTSMVAYLAWAKEVVKNI